MKQTVGSVIEERGREIWSIAPTATVYRALQVLAEHNIGAVIVMDGETLVGIISERDYARKVILAERSSRDTLVREIMTPNPYTVQATQTVEDCMQLMLDGNFRHLPVLRDSTVIGVVSVVDILEAVAQNQASLIVDLERYISSG